MMATDTKTIYSDINAHIKKSGINNSGWYVGITSDVEERLFGFHQVPRENHWFIYRRAINSDEARGIEAAYHKAGCDGARGGGDDAAVYIYAYVISQKTVERN
jgi:hypothetical protein